MEIDFLLGLSAHSLRRCNFANPDR